MTTRGLPSIMFWLGPDGDFDLGCLAHRRIILAEIQAIVACHYELPVRIMRDATRFRVHARPRQVSMYLSRHLTHLSLPEIGRRHGGRDHTTVLHALRQIDRLRATDPILDRAVRELAGEIVT